MRVTKRFGLFIAIFLTALLGFLFSDTGPSFSAQKPQVIYFHQETCQECKKTEPFIKEIEERYSDQIILEKLEVTSSQEARNAYFAFANKYGLDTAKIGVPLLFLGDKSFLGRETIVDRVEDEIKSSIDKPKPLRIPLEDAKKISASEGGEISCADETICEAPQTSKLTIPIIISAAAIDSINPCAIAVLIILISFLLGIKATKGRMLWIGLIYIGAVYAAYLLAGLGILKFIQILPLEVEWIQIFAAVFLFIFALLNFSDALSAISGRGKSTLAIPQSAKPFIQKYLSKATVFGALIAGVIVSFVELPCTGAVYFGILSLLAASGETYMKGLLYLLFYNLIFVAPLVVILFAAVAGKDVRVFERFSKGNKAFVKALMGSIIIVLISALIWPIRDFLSIQFQNLADFAGGKEISSEVILAGVLILITTLYFLLAYAKPAITKKINLFYCAICYAVSLTWLGLLALLILGYKFDTNILAALLGMSVTGIMYQLESFFKENNIKRFWLFRIILVNVGIALIYGIIFNSSGVLLVGLLGVLILILLFFYLASRKNPDISKPKGASSGKKKGKALSELENRLENCC
jgi:cytochrome c biogenesis protein CcdA